MSAVERGCVELAFKAIVDQMLRQGAGMSAKEGASGSADDERGDSRQCPSSNT